MLNHTGASFLRNCSNMGRRTFTRKSKAGLDGVAQQDALLRSSSSHFMWAQRIVSQTMKSLAIKEFFGLRMVMREDKLESRESLQILDNFKNILKSVQGTADLMFDVCQELLNHARKLWWKRMKAPIATWERCEKVTLECFRGLLVPVSESRGCYLNI